MNIPDKVQKIIDSNIKSFEESEKRFDSIDDNSVEGLSLKEKERAGVEKILRQIALNVACNHIPFKFRKDNDIGEKLHNRMKEEIKRMRIEKINGNLI